ncbi:MAG: DNA/RNA non-specific endonuclease [Acidobacteriota bacterium]
MNVRRYFVLLLLCFAFLAQTALAVSPNVVISQVYGGGGNSGANFRNDYIELFNRGTSPVTLTGWSVQYSSSTGTGLFSSNVTNLSGTINPGQYYLVQEASTAAVGAVLPTPNATGTIAMASGAGKVVLVNGGGLACNGSSTPCNAAQLAQIVDLVGYGGGTNFSEGNAPTATLTNTTAAIRKANGCTDTDNNAADFNAAAGTPRNSSTTIPPCTITNNPPSINAPANPITSVLQNAAPFNVSLTGSDDNNIFSWSATPGTGVSSVTVASGQGTANIGYTVTLVSNFTGTATFTASLTDNVNAPVTRTVNIQVNAAPVNNPPTITPPLNPITTVESNAPAFTVSLTGNDDGAIYNWSASPSTGISLVTVTGGQGTATATFTVMLQGGFSGTATFTAFLSDNVNAPAAQAVNITVTAPPPPPNHLVISQVYGGGGNSGATYQNDYVEIYNPTVAPVDIAGWTLQYFSATSTGPSTNMQPLGGVVGPGEYFLVSLASGGAVGAPLPLANIDGSINMSATAGKIALASNGDPLIGPSGCPVGSDPDLVDFVGYGTTANCREGSTNAPAASNTTALFRKNSGLTDTDVNGFDFVVGAPNPRRTTPIQEIGPFVVTTDPASGASIAPKDASITITFSEPVDVTGTWYDITCVSSGNHGINDATFAVTDGGGTHVITPNANFTPGEQCTVTVFKTQIHDVDLDDSGANTDTLPANKIWTFTVATGAAPPYTSDVHLTFGNPSGAIADVNFPNNYLMEKPGIALSYNRDKGTPNWVSWHLETAWYGTLARVDTFRPDPAVPPDWYRVQAFDFFASGFDRGHMTPNADRDNENRIPVNQETYLMSNMVPQAPDNNQGPWANMENALRGLTDAGNELYIVSGPWGVGGTGSNGGVSTTLAGGHVTVPAQTWKVVLVLPKASGDDVARATASTRTIAVIMPNTQGIRTTNSNDWQGYLVSVDQVEALTGYDFFANVSDSVENAVEAGVNGNNPPGAANQSIATNEDTAKTFTLDAVSPTNAPLTYTITTAPSHGALSCTASCTYTPAPDFNGTDSFKYTASNSSGTSNTATVSITVFEVNDPPTAANDVKSTDEDTTLTFAASDLTSNDSAGPANESGQSLTVVSVSSTADTHGSVSLAGGQVTYSPAANYNGPASFTYHVCDNGITAGLADAKCADATVNVTVNPVNDPPTATVSAPSTSPEGTAVTASATASDPDSGDSLSYAWSVTKNGSPYASGSGASITFTPDDNGSYVAAVVVTDGSGATAGSSQTVAVTNVAPAITAASLSSASVAENGSVTISGSFTDPGSDDTHVVTVNWSDGVSTSSLVKGARTFSLTHQYLDDAPSGTASDAYAVSVTVSDDDGGNGSAGAGVTVNNVAPLIASVTGPTAPIAFGGAASISFNYTDAGTLDTHTATVTWGDASSSAATCAAGTCTASHTYGAAGVYTVGITLTDDDTGTATATFADVVVYDTDGGFVTGGGWINSGGKGNVGFNVKYQDHDATTPSGNLEFQIPGGGKLNFKSTSFDWLVITGAKAQTAGHGTVDGVAGYAFVFTATDGKMAGDKIDKFRIRITKESTNTVVFDNSAAGADVMGGGNITIHQ